ncbi:hypothetical protein H0H87_000410 [Tephrocybe sp. NHM501043]|nr:hypothetical protein H0H87_000410 [Tephrocybe sp. NHM501043]
MADAHVHLPEEIVKNPARVVVETRFGPVTGGRASTGAAAFLEIPYALPPGRFEDPVALPDNFKYDTREYIFETKCNPNDIQITGLSAGAHSVHQLLHRVSRLPEGQNAPFTTNPQTPEEYRVQFEALCRALNLDLEAPDVLDTLRDPVKVPWSSITRVIETDVLGAQGTFRGCLADDWVPKYPDPVAWQRSGGFAQGLRAHGVRSIVVGDLSEEWYLYSIAHPIRAPCDIVPNLKRYQPKKVVERFVDVWRKIPDDSPMEEAEKLYGEILSCGQVHMPVRVLAEDLYNAEYPVLRYTIEWTPEQNRTGGEWSRGKLGSHCLTKCCGTGYVTHGTDRCIWTLRKPILEPDQEMIAKRWLNRVDAEVKNVEREGKPFGDAKTVLTLTADTTIGWRQDKHWERISTLRSAIEA